MNKEDVAVYIVNGILYILKYLVNVSEQNLNVCSLEHIFEKWRDILLVAALPVETKRVFSAHTYISNYCKTASFVLCINYEYRILYQGCYTTHFWSTYTYI